VRWYWLAGFWRHCFALFHLGLVDWLVGGGFEVCCGWWVVLGFVVSVMWLGMRQDGIVVRLRRVGDMHGVGPCPQAEQLRSISHRSGKGGD
jgi:hypothetical protein